MYKRNYTTFMRCRIYKSLKELKRPSASLKVMANSAIQQSTCHNLLITHCNYVTILYYFRYISQNRSLKGHNVTLRLIIQDFLLDNGKVG